MAIMRGIQPESGTVTILDDWRLRLSSISYISSERFLSEQRVFFWVLWSLCLMSAPRVLKTRKQILFVHLNPTKQDLSGGTWLISNIWNIPCNRSESFSKFWKIPCRVILKSAKSWQGGEVIKKCFHLCCWQMKLVMQIKLCLNVAMYILQRIDNENHDSAKTIYMLLTRAIQIENKLSVLSIQTKLQVEFFLPSACINSAVSFLECGKSVSTMFWKFQFFFYGGSGRFYFVHSRNRTAHALPSRDLLPAAIWLPWPECEVNW